MQMISVRLMKAPLITITTVFFYQGNHAHARIYTCAYTRIHLPTHTHTHTHRNMSHHQQHFVDKCAENHTQKILYNFSINVNMYDKDLTVTHLLIITFSVSF